MNEQTWRAAGLAGLVLVVVSIWLDAFGGESYWNDGTQGVFLLAVSAVAALMLVMSWTQQRAQPARVACALSFLLLGYTLFIVATTAFGNWGDLDIGAWLALAGSAVAVVGSWAGSASMGTEPSWTSSQGQQGVQMGLLAALAGVALCVVAIWLDAAGPTSYWNFSEDKILGVVMLVVCAVTGLAVLAAWMGRGQSAALWASLFAMLMLGLYGFGVVSAAFNSWGDLEIGVWLGFVGALVAAVGTELAHMASARTAHAATPAPAL